MNLTVNQRVTRLLSQSGATFRCVDHGPTKTSAESAAARGEPIEHGAKALVLKAGDRFVVGVLRAHLRMDAKVFRKQLSCNKLRFATAAELLELTGLVSGAVPPFGEPVLPLPLYLDASLAEFDRVAFNTGSLTQSVVLPTADYLTLVESMSTMPAFWFGREA